MSLRPKKTEVIKMESKGRGRRPVEDITDKQHHTLKEIRRFMNNRGFPPDHEGTC